MGTKILYILIILAFVLTGCGQADIESNTTFLDHNANEVTLPQEKPVVFFFITNYTWGICQQQLVQLHKNINKLDDLDVNVYIVSADTPEEQLVLHDALKKEFGTSISFISDPNLDLIESFNMKNGDEAFRGYGLLDNDGNVVFNTINDHWGEQFDKTEEKIREEYKKLIDSKWV